MKKSRKSLLLIFAIAILSALFAFNVSAKTSGDLTYKIQNGEAIITDCKESASGKLEIPSKLDGYPVTKIGNYAFDCCTGLKSITIPDSVTSLDIYAFEDCVSLKSITIPDSVTSIGEGAFYGCTGLKSIKIGSGVTSISERAFNDCTGLKSINVDQNNKKYSSKNGVLFNKNKTDLISYPCSKDESKYSIPNSVTGIGDYAFTNCENLTSITIPDSVTSIGSAAFRGCTAIKSITIPDSVTSIGWRAFYNTGYYNNSSNWENDVLYIGNYLVDAKSSITGSYKIKSGTKCIAEHAFYYYSNLTSITIPDSVTSIGSSAFKCCIGLTSIDVSKDNKYYSSINGVLLNKNGSVLIQYPAGKTATSYIIPDSVTSIGDYAFYENRNLKKVAIPKSVKAIGYEALGCCEGGQYSGSRISDFKIEGVKGTAAETYAKNYGFEFIVHSKHTYKTTTTKATTSKSGSKVTACTFCGKVKSKSTIAKIKSVTLSNDTFTYNGKVKQPTVTVKDSKGNKLTKGTDYTVKYSSGRKNVGKYTVTVTFKGNYSGTKKLTFKIKPKGTSISKLTAGTKKFTVNIKKQATQTTGYQVQYSKNSSMKSATTKTYASTSKTSRTISGLKSATKYYVRVRTYKNVKINGKTYKYFSTWSSIKSVKTK